MKNERNPIDRMKNTALWLKEHPIAILLAFSLLVRFYNIDSPLIGAHSWRQTQTAMIARNFQEHGYMFFYPQVDWGGNSPGYFESEFPIYSYLIAPAYEAEGFGEVWARFLTILASLCGIYFLYRLVRNILGERIAVWSAGFFALLPLQVFYSRVVMPDMVMLASMIAGVHFFNEWLGQERRKHLILSALCVSLAGLIKPTALHIGLPLLFLAWTKFGKGMLFRKALWGYAAGVFLPVALWYYHAHTIRLDGGLSVDMSDKWGNWDLVLTAEFWNRIVFQSLAERHLTWAGFIAFAVGLFLKRESVKEKLFDAWLVAVVVYFMIVGMGNYVHEYYQLPFIIPAAVILGKVYGRYFNWKEGRSAVKWSLIAALLLISAAGVWRYSVYMQFEDEESSAELKFASAIKNQTSPSALIGLMARNDPTLLYLSDRKGWHVTMEHVANGQIDSLVQSGMTHLVGADRYLRQGEKSIVDSVMAKYSKITDKDGFFIYTVGEGS